MMVSQMLVSQKIAHGAEPYTLEPASRYVAVGPPRTPGGPGTCGAERC
jgi:hypothetical protein